MDKLKRVVLLGGTGYIGSVFQKYLRDNNICYSNLSRKDLDYYQPDLLVNYLKTFKPDFLINCSGYTGKPNVDACEDYKTDAIVGNVVLPGRIKEACEAIGLPWGHVSSGCIYTGKRPDGKGFSESDTPNFSFRTNNCSFYSGTKALGEEVLQGTSQCYIWRLRIPFNSEDSPRNYLSKLMRYDILLEAENSLTCLEDFPRVCLSCFYKEAPFGIYNMTNPGQVTTSEVVALITKELHLQKEFRFFVSEKEFMKKAAKTPRSNCVLDTSKVLSLGIEMDEVHDAIVKCLRKWKWENK